MRQEQHSEEYERARDAFDHLKIEDRAVFLIEATVSTIARGVETAGRVLADQLDRMFRMRPDPAAGGASTGSTAQGGTSTSSEERRPNDAGGTDSHVET